ncbi:MAG: hypothetical protein E7401_05900 [Ruminococcaceae bacterium]|nr:hypothetical protein [Oscillospiraceae bacterium]
MTRTIKALCVIVGLICTLQAVIPTTGEKVSAKIDTIKGVWAATVFSLDFPQKPTTDPDILKKDADALIDKANRLGYNTLYFQVRPSGDAFYESEIFPWSEYLTGEQGLAPQNGFDPLEYIIDAAHKKEIELHAWINPYRITASEKSNATQTEQSIAKKYPQLAVKHSDGKLYLNPGEPESNKLVVDGALEIIRNYDVDGIHIDDYFYPSGAFPDSETFTRYGGSFRDIGDWRRDNTTSLIKALRDAIKAEDPSCIFSVSPSGIWANKKSHPEGSDSSGIQSYFDNYADTRLWVKENLIDVIIPQIYWNIGYEIADFKKITNWWNDTVRGTSVRLCIGQGTYRVSDETNPTSVWYGENGQAELKSQLKLLNSLDNIHGYSHYRLGSAADNGGFADFIKKLNTQKLRSFTDTEGYPWAEEAIERLYQKGIVNGMGDGTFGSSRTVTRADFTIMLVRLTEQNVPFAENFADVTEDKYYYKEIGIAKALGYASGRENNIFDPLGNITREDMATLAYRVLVKEGRIGEGNPEILFKKFPDANEISEYAREAVAAMTEDGYLGGYETGEFKPKGLATRAETAVFLDRISQ